MLYCFFTINPPNSLIASLILIRLKVVSIDFSKSVSFQLEEMSKVRLKLTDFAKGVIVLLSDVQWGRKVFRTP